MPNKLLRRVSFVTLCSYLLTFFLSIVSPVYASTSYSYDANGNVTNDGVHCFTYNDANKLSKVDDCHGKKIAEYMYDDQGNRFEQKIYDENGNLKKTIYTPSDSYQTVKLASNSATENTTYYYANDQLIAQKDPNGEKKYMHPDHLGSTSLVTDQNGNVVEQTTYDEWGNVQTGGTQTKYQYTGQEKDADTNLNYYNARYYDPQTKHFTQPDDIIPNIYDPQSLNRYSYVKNNPLRYTDPSGHCPVCVVAGVVLSYVWLGYSLGGAVDGAIHSQDQSLGGRIKSAGNGFYNAGTNAIGGMLSFAATVGMAAGEGGGKNTTTVQRETNIQNTLVQEESNNNLINSKIDYAKSVNSKIQANGYNGITF